MNKNVKYVHNQLSLAVPPATRASLPRPENTPRRAGYAAGPLATAVRLGYPPAAPSPGCCGYPMEPQQPCTRARGEAPAGHKAGLSLATRQNVQVNLREHAQTTPFTTRIMPICGGAMGVHAVSNATEKRWTVHGPTNLRPCRFEVSRVASRLPRHTHAAVSQRHGG